MNNHDSHKKRYIVFDIAKGIGIILVAVFHLVYRAENGVIDNLIRESIWLLIPFFFAVSACFFNPLKRNFKQNIIQRVHNLLVPSVLFTVIFLVIFGIHWGIFHDYKFSEWISDFTATFLRPEFFAYFSDRNLNDAVVFDINSSVWFVWVMLIADPLFYYSAEKIFSKQKNLVKLFSLCFLLVLISFALYDYNNYFSWSLLLVPFYTAVMLLGTYLALSGNIEIILSTKYSYFYALIAFAVHILMFRFCGSSGAFMNELGTIGKWSVFTCFIQTFIGGYAFLTFCNLLRKVKYVSDYLAFIGRNSLYFLLMHRPFGAMCADLMGTYVKSGNYWYVELTHEIVLKSIIAFLFSMFMCSLCSLLVNYFRLRNRRQFHV